MSCSSSESDNHAMQAQSFHFCKSLITAFPVSVAAISILAGINYNIITHLEILLSKCVTRKRHTKQKKMSSLKVPHSVAWLITALSPAWPCSQLCKAGNRSLSDSVSHTQVPPTIWITSIKKINVIIKELTEI